MIDLQNKWDNSGTSYTKMLLWEISTLEGFQEVLYLPYFVWLLFTKGCWLEEVIFPLSNINGKKEKEAYHTIKH